MKFDSGESAFNFAVEYLKSIKVSLDNAKAMAIQQNVDGWYHWLRAGYREVALITKPEEDESFEEKFKELNILLNDPSKKIIQKKEILKLLDALEIKLRKTIQKKGMGLPKSSDPRFAVLQR